MMYAAQGRVPGKPRTPSPPLTPRSLGYGVQEFNIQKLNLVEAEKVKIRKDYERKDGQVEVKKRM
jgi:hypothetical protein